MSDTHDTKKLKKGLSRLKLDIPLLGKGKKKLNPIEKKAAEFLSTRRGKTNEAVHCGPDSVVGVVVDKDQAVLQVELLNANDGDKEGDKELDALPANLNIAKLYKDCFEAKKSYQLALNAFVAHENKRGSAAASPTSSSQAPAPAPEPDVPTRMTFEELEENIEQMGRDVEAAVDKLQDVKGERNARQQEQCQVVRGLRTCFHKFADNARNVKSYVSLVPKSAGFGLGGLICGGINIVLKAAMEGKTQGAVRKVLRRQSLELNTLEELRKGQEDIKAQFGGVVKAVEQARAATTAEIGELKSQTEQLARLSGANVVQTIWVLISQDPPLGRTTGDRAPVHVRRRLPASRPTAPTHPPAAPRTRSKPAQAAKPRLDLADVLADVGFKPDLVPGDGRNILRAARARLSTQDDRLVAEMTNHVRLQALVEVPSSSVLFVEGGPDGRHEARGPISVATARVVAALARGRETNPSLYALAYFCSEHRSARQGFGTAMALVITLLLQLIDQHRDFGSQLLDDCHGAVADPPAQPLEHDVRGFCDLLQRCVLALPAEATLFCVVEGIAFFEGPRERTEHMRIILSRLLELADEEAEVEDGHARVKFLFTTPARSPEFMGLFQPYDVLTMQAVNSSGFFRRKSWIIGRIGNSEQG